MTEIYYFDKERYSVDGNMYTELIKSNEGEAYIMHTEHGMIFSKTPDIFFEGRND